MTQHGIQPAQAAESNAPEDSFAALFEQEGNNTVINVGEVALGTVVGLAGEEVIIDVDEIGRAHV